MQSNIVVSVGALLCYSCATFGIGYLLIRPWGKGLPALLVGTGAFLLGVGISIPTTYLLSCVFASSTEPLLFGVLGYMGVSLGCIWYVLRRSNKKILFPVKHRVQLNMSTMSDILLFLFCLLFSFWIMGKTLRGGVDGQIFVGGNTVFDFGQMLGIVRSFSWGANIPMMSPFFSGAQFFYHFFFLFWISLWEYFGVPFVWAANIPSILSFTALLIIVYYLPQVVGKEGKLVGWLSVLLTITHSTLTFWYFLFQKGFSIQFLIDMWRIGKYPFAGPFDGSIISIFTTLNPYVNQRHLAFSIALGLFLLMIGFEMIEKKQSAKGKDIFLGMYTGLLFLFNMSVSLFVGLGMNFLFVFRKHWSHIFLYSGTVVIIIAVFLVPFFLRITDVIGFLGLFYDSGLSAYTQTPASWTIAWYLWNNMGILPAVAVIGLAVMPKKSRIFYGMLTVLFMLMVLFAGLWKRGFDQKFYSFSIIGVNITAAISLGWIYRKGVLWKICAVMLVAMLTISGVVDLCVLKNEFAYPLVSRDILPVITWIKNNTPKNAVFVSYSDIIDPVALSGRSNYFGFFGNTGWYDRSPIVKDIYMGDIRSARKLGISYVLAPKFEKNDFPYVVDTEYFKEQGLAVYEDERFVIFKTEMK